MINNAAWCLDRKIVVLINKVNYHFALYLTEFSAEFLVEFLKLIMWMFIKVNLL